MHARRSLFPLAALALFALVLSACSTGPGPEPDTQTLTVVTEGDGSVTSAPTGIDCPGTCEVDFDAGDEVTLTATPDDGQVFAGWSGGGCDGTGDCTVTMDQDRTVTATFEAEGGVGEPVQLTVAVQGEGSVTSDPAGIDCPDDCEEGFAPDTEVTLTATAAEGATFDSWAGACADAEGATCTVTLAEAANVTATFTTADGGPFPLTVSVEGDGSVTSDPAGIDCPDACDAEFDADAEVTLTATAAEGATFAGWTGACSGSGDCTVTMTGASTVTASFVGDGDVTTETFSIQASNDDAEEFIDGADGAANFPPGSIQETGDDLDLAYDTNWNSAIHVGLRFAGVTIPEGAVVTDASITFTPIGPGVGTVTLDIHGEAADDPGGFTHEPGVGNADISSRAATGATVNWGVNDPWTAATVDSPDLSGIVQEIVDRDGWASGNAMVFVVSSDDSDASNYRRAVSFDNDPTAAPQLEVTYTVP